MPKISESRRAERRTQILDAAIRCFHRDGFHQATMDDIITESGLSAGAVYQYFGSKADLIAQVVDRVTGRLGAIIAAESTSGEGPAVVLPRILAAVDDIATQSGVDTARLVVHAWSETQRDEALRERATAMFARLQDVVSPLLERWRDQGYLSPGADPVAAAPALLSLVQGYLVQRAVVGTIDRDAYAAGVLSLIAWPGEPASPTREVEANVPR